MSAATRATALSQECPFPSTCGSGRAVPVPGDGTSTACAAVIG
jgi:hypothetical protein